MTPGAQQALRRTMEIYANTTRFALACNQSNKIIELIQRRSAILRYVQLSDSEILKRLIEICGPENVKYSSDGLASLIFTSEEICAKRLTICSRHTRDSHSFLQSRALCKLFDVRSKRESARTGKIS
ncbi:hypothetical protein BT69DRAFT_1367893 [Atractiella rhizophila]|nr:hypothetical protein BT69DRAFT_1367893 [Atractiella rhizophila]